MKKTFLLIMLLSISNLSYSQNRIGDGGRTFDSSNTVNVNIANFQSKRQRWANAGVINGIRKTGGGYEQVLPFSDTSLDASAAIQAAIDKVVTESGGAGGLVRIRQGTYTIKNTIHMKKGVSVIGEGATNTVLRVEVNSGSVVSFKDLNNSNSQTSGLKNLRFWGTKGDPNDALMSDAKPSYNAKTVEIVRSKNCYMDNVHILNSGNSPVSTWSGSHHSFRDLYIDGCWNKGGGGHCYFAIQSPDCLVYSSEFRGLRHFTLQREYCEYNVVYDNTIYGDVNFHNADEGNNLIEANTITLPSYLSGSSGRRYVVMGPWSTQHAPSARDNYVYNNTVTNNAFSGTPRCNLGNKIYRGADKYEPNITSRPHGNPFVNTTNIDYNRLIYSTKAISNSNQIEAPEVVGLDFPEFTTSNKAFTIGVHNKAANPYVRIVDFSGYILLEQELNAGKSNTINTDFLKAGVYIISLSSTNGTITKKIAVKP
ncbi:T9SS type A sorting domain-containing protein [Ochrovirga pacifica]|uniref:T9SS type A sorting domain-containing protein n=1 Tax=Ochrovirga pacifica TaxID=1042376 RepID=UPI0002558EB5|nr:T9SS type A sorting domain-containing protein [Ochrovirga pacifica]